MAKTKHSSKKVLIGSQSRALMSEELQRIFQRSSDRDRAKKALGTFPFLKSFAARGLLSAFQKQSAHNASLRSRGKVSASKRFHFFGLQPASSRVRLQSRCESKWRLVVKLSQAPADDEDEEAVG